MSGEVRIARSVDETERFGEALAPALATGDVLALTGDLGAGKTRFVAGLARGLRCKARVRSPSFAIVNEYHGDRLLLHLDLYRLDTVDAESLGLEEYAERGVLVVEWGERLPHAWLAEALHVTLVPGEADTRTISAEGHGERGRHLHDAWCALPEAW